MKLTQQKLDGLIAQLNMAQAKPNPSSLQIAMLKAKINELRKLLTYAK